MKFEFETKGYSDKKGNIRPNLVTVEAQQVAQKLANNERRADDVTKSQLRAFYADVKAIENRMKDGNDSFSEEKFEKNLYRVLMLKSKAAYRKNNGSSKLSENFKQFIDKNVDRIKKENSVESFKNFTVFFEAVIGYCYAERISD